jgi:hypothetical protein
MRIRHLAAAALALAIASPARADTVTLKNGREIHGRLVEERQDSIRMRTEGGTITIQKAEIASFTEGEVFMNYGGSGRTGDPAAQPGQPGQPPPAQPGQPGQPPAQPGQPGQPPAQPGQPGQMPPSAATWTWAPGVTADKIATLTPIRDRYLEELAALGKTPEERLAALAITAEERSRLQELITRFNWHRRQGSANAQRNNAKDDAVAFGIKALPFINDALQSESQWTARTASDAMAALVQRPGGDLKVEDARWLMYHHDVPGRLISLLDHQGEPDSPFIRADANAALEAVTGHDANWPANQTEALRSQDESEAKRRWEQWWSAEKRRWDQEVAAAATKRTDLAAKLALVREGRNPEEAPATPPR